MQRLLTAAFALASIVAVASSVGVSVRSSSPDLGGIIPAFVAPAVHTSTNLVVMSPGLVLSTAGDEIPGATLIATTASGDVVDQVDSARDGEFTFVTPAGSVLYLTIPETSVVNVPFVPGQPLVVVLP